MTPETVVAIFQNSLEVTLLLCMVVLVPALVVGLIVSMLQAATQINEMTLSFIPKLIITVATLIFAGPWLLRVLIEFTKNLLHDIPYIVG